MDSESKKILIFHASAGHGHLKAAEAIQKSISEERSGWIVELHDGLDFFPKWIKKIYVGSYLWMITKAPFIWGFFYYLSNFKATFFITAIKRRIFNQVFGSKLSSKIVNEKPDLVISTHFMPPEVFQSLKAKGKTKSKSLTVITDFLVHRFWVQKEIDKYLVASEKTKQVLVWEGIEMNKVKVTGIPIDEKFSKGEEKAKVREKLGVSKEKFVILFTSGGHGQDDMLNLVKNACKSKPNFHAVGICGNNANLKQKMDSLAEELSNITSLGFVDNMNEWMDACDVVVGKAGGLTVSESLAKKRPLFIIDPVPGQEVLNAKVLVSQDAAVWVSKKSQLTRLLHQFEQDSGFRSKIQSGIDKISTPNSTKSVTEVIIDMLEKVDE